MNLENRSTYWPDGSFDPRKQKTLKSQMVSLWDQSKLKVDNIESLLKLSDKYELQDLKDTIGVGYQSYASANT